MNPAERLRHHVTGAIARGEAAPIIEQAAPFNYRTLRDLRSALRYASRIVVTRVSVSRLYPVPGSNLGAHLFLNYADGTHAEINFASCDICVRFVMVRVNRKGGLFSAATSVVVPSGYDDTGRPERTA